MNAIESKLTEMRASLLERKARVHKHLTNPDEPLPQDWPDQAVLLENEETVVALEQQLSRELSEVEHALKRLSGGLHGQCERCGETIADARLTAIPETSLCVHCADG